MTLKDELLLSLMHSKIYKELRNYLPSVRETKEVTDRIIQIIVETAETKK